MLPYIASPGIASTGDPLAAVRRVWFKAKEWFNKFSNSS